MNNTLAIVGAGLVGRRHALAVQRAEGASLVAIVDPDPQANALAEQYAVDHLSNIEQLLNGPLPQGIVLATPNQMHVEQALQCLAAGVPVLVEKPLAVDIAGAEAIVEQSRRCGVPVLTGHHRRHNPLVAKARQVIDQGALGNICAVQATTWFYKPDDYFDVPWRRQAGAGPVYINLIHDIDMLRHLCGEVAQVQAMQTSHVRGHEVEDTAVILLRFHNGALGTMSVSDTIVAPWSWELTARENPAYPATAQACYQIGGTQASLALPNLSLWQHGGQRSWWEPISEAKLPGSIDDPLVCQIEQFVRVIEHQEPPLVSAEDGLANQRIIEAVKQSAESGTSIMLPE